MDVRRAEINLERIKEKEKRKLCGTYPGGPEGYRYIPARCVRINPPDEQRRRKKSSRRKEEEDSPDLDRIPKNELRLLRRQHVPLVNRINELHERVQRRQQQTHIQRPQNEIELFADREAASFYQDLLTYQPLFILNCTERMLHVQLMRDFPDINARYIHIANALEEFEGQMFRNNNDVEYVIMKLCLKRLQDMGILTHP